eukprot:3036386-Prymnesium_polylepis.1
MYGIFLEILSDIFPACFFKSRIKIVTLARVYTRYAERPRDSRPSLRHTALTGPSDRHRALTSVTDGTTRERAERTEREIRVSRPARDRDARRTGGRGRGVTVSS